MFKVEQSNPERNHAFVFGYAIWSTALLLMFTNSIVLLCLNLIFIIAVYLINRFNVLKIAIITSSILLLIAIPWIVQTVFASWNVLVEKLGKLYGLQFKMFDYAAFNEYVLMLIVFVFHMIILSTQSKKIIIGMTLIVTALFVYLQLNHWVYLLLLIMSAIVIYVASNHFWRRYGLQVIGVSIITFICVSIVLPNKSVIQKIPHLFQHEAEKKYAKDEEYTWMRNGSIAEIGEKTNTKQKALTVVMEKPQPMYLKGFIGKEFNEDQWFAQSFGEAAEYNDLFYWLNKEKFTSNSMLANLQFKVGHTERSTIVVSNEQADQRYRYVPYGVVGEPETKQVQLDGLEKYPSSSDNKYSIENNVLVNFAKNASEIDEKKMKKYLTLEANYRKFVQQQYLDVSKEDQLILQQDFKKQSKIDYEKSIQFVQELVAKNIRYNEKAIGKKQAVSTIWQTERKGYAPQYATVGTLAFRMMGIPARYVEGFVITKDQTEKKKPFAEIEVPLSSAHAWTEIYIDQVGWVPIELVPKIRKEMPEVKAAYVPKGNHVSKNPTANGTNSSDGSNELAHKEIQDHENQTPPQPKREKVEKQWFILASILLFVLCIVLVVSIIIIRRRNIRKLYKQLKSDSTVEHLQASIHLSEIWLKARLPHYEENASLTNKLSQMSNQLSKEAIELFENTYKNYQAAKYGGVEVSKSQLVTIMKKELIKPLKWWQKLKFKWILMKY